MLSKQQVKNITALHQKKIRKSEKLFIAEGEKIIADLLSSDWEIELLCATDSITVELKELVSKKYRKELFSVTEEDMNKISPLSTPQGILAVVRQKEFGFDISQLKNELVLVLDDVQDPGNVGTILRIADWFGIKSIICSPNTADCYNPKVVQASMGSLFRISIYHMDLTELFQLNADTINLPVYGTLMEGENIFSANLSNSGFLIFGNESNGIHEILIPFLTKRITIPSFKESSADSLNVAIASGIVCAEFRRRNPS